MSEALGNPLRFLLTAGQEADISHAKALVGEYRPKAFIGDKGYDADHFLLWLKEQNIEQVIPPRRSRKEQRQIDTNLYRDRNKIERLWNRLKQYRRIATRYDKTARNYLSFVFLASTILWLL
jgi:putative transposase